MYKENQGSMYTNWNVRNTVLFLLPVYLMSQEQKTAWKVIAFILGKDTQPDFVVRSHDSHMIKL